MVYRNQQTIIKIILLFECIALLYCLSSIYCYLGVRKLDNVSKTYKTFAVIMTILICMSTVFTKQHYFADIIGGLAVPVICHAVIMKLDPASRLIKEKL